MVGAKIDYVCFAQVQKVGRKKWANITLGIENYFGAMSINREALKFDVGLVSVDLEVNFFHGFSYSGSPSLSS